MPARVEGPRGWGGTYLGNKISEKRIRWGGIRVRVGVSFKISSGHKLILLPLRGWGWRR